MKILKLFALAVMLVVPAMASAADKLPEGFIAMSESEMTWDQAKAWCQERGGRLPLIGGSSSLRDVPRDPSADGFGYVGGPGASGLPGGRYWTDTEVADNPGYSWIVVDDGGLILSHRRQSSQGRVVCVPPMAAAADRLPEAFIAISESFMSWADARAFCRQQGGRLPLIGGSSSRHKVSEGIPIDGFDVLGALWPAGLPRNYYWTDTEGPDDPGNSWFVWDSAGYVSVSYNHQNKGNRAVCVP